MIIFPLVMTMSGFLIMLAIHHLDQSLGNYYDFVALTMVLGGTATVLIGLLPWEYRKDLKTAFGFLIRPEITRYNDLMGSCVSAIKNGRHPTPAKMKWLYEKILSDGLELIQLGFSRDRIESILSERTFHSVRRWRRVANAFKSLAKYPPAFGLMGTVFGLVNIMKNLAGAKAAGQLGVEMSVALVATMYGLLVSNFVVNPMGELLMRKADEEEEYAGVALEAVLLIKDQVPLLESVEVLNAMAPEERRKKLGDLSSMDSMDSSSSTVDSAA